MPIKVRIIGAGLAGSEAAWQCARRGVPVDLYEMRPVRTTPAHQTAHFAELVCSNSLKSDSENTAPWLLKEEMRRAGSLLMQVAAQTAVPAGHALAVDRENFSAAVTEAIEREPQRADLAGVAIAGDDHGDFVVAELLQADVHGVTVDDDVGGVDDDRRHLSELAQKAYELAALFTIEPLAKRLTNSV